MPQQLFKVVLCLIVLSAPLVLLAPPTFTPSLPDVTPIDQQTVALASGGLIYAYYKFRAGRKGK